MSVINQMLKDLDNRRGPANGVQLAALQGMGLLNVNRIQWQTGLPLIGRGFAAVLAVIIGYQSIGWWLDNGQGTAATGHTLKARVAVTPASEVSPALPVESEADAKQFPVIVKNPQPPTARARTDELQTSQPAPVRSLAPVKILTPGQQAEQLFARAQLAFADHRQRRGEQLLLDTLDASPGHSDARTQLAVLLISRQQTEEAELLLADGLSTDPYSLELARPYARLLAARGALIPALETLDRAIDQDGADAEALALRAALLYRMDRHAESVTAYRQALNDQPHRALWWTGLAVSLEHSGESVHALAAYRRAADFPLEKAVDDYVRQRIERLQNAEPYN